MATQPFKCIGGDFIGDGGIRFGILWSGPAAEKFHGMSLSMPEKLYAPNEIIKVIEMGQEQAKSFLSTAVAASAGALIFGGIGLIAGALAGGKKNNALVAVEFSDGKKVAFSVDQNNKPFACMKLYALDNGLIEHSF